MNSQITSSVGLINSYAQQIATLNHQIVVAEAGGNGQPANDLLDQRDLIVANLNKEINVSVVKQDDGSYNIFMGKGQALVVGQQALTLSARPMPDDPESMGVAYVSYGGSAQMLPSDSLDGGNLGGLLAFRSETLDKAQNELGRVAIGLAQTFNDQHRLGQDLNGDLGGNYFNVPAERQGGCEYAECLFIRCASRDADRCQQRDEQRLQPEQDRRWVYADTSFRQYRNRLSRCGFSCNRGWLDHHGASHNFNGG